MKNATKLILGILCLSFISCSSEEEDDSHFSTDYNFDIKLSQPEILDVNKDGITLHYDIEGFDIDKITEYGVVWYIEESPILEQNCKVSNDSPLSSNRVIQQISNGLPQGKNIYIRAFAVLRDSVFYGQFVSVTPINGVTSMIDSISPQIVKASQRITIQGDFFIRTFNRNYQSILVNDFEITPDSVSETKLVFSLPEDFLNSYKFNETLKIEIKSFDKKITSSQTVKLKSPWRSIDIPEDIFPSTVYRGTAACLEDKGYIFLRYQMGSYVYDLINHKWTQEDGSTVTAKSYAYVVDNSLYFFANPELYVKRNSSWEYVTSYPGDPEKDISPFTYYYDNYLYRGNFDTNYMGKGRSFYRYSLKDKFWEKLSPIPNNGGGIYVHFFFPDNGELNIGAIRNNEAWEFSKNIRVWTYSPIKDTWSWNFQPDDNFSSEFPVTDDVNEVISFTIKEQTFMGLGRNHDWPEYCSDMLWMFNSKSRKWNLVSRCPKKMNPVATFIYEDKAYILGTNKEGNNKYFYEFDPSSL